MSYDSDSHDSIVLRSHQKDFINKFLSSEVPFWELIAPTGSGKTYIGSYILSNLIKNHKKRFLIIAPRAAILEQWSEVLNKIQKDFIPMILSRKSFLELELKKYDEKSLFPENSIILISLDLAKRQEVIDDLLEVKWDFVIFDESHILTVGERKNFAETLLNTKNVERALLLTSVNVSHNNIDVRKEIISLHEILDYRRDIYSDKVVLPLYYRRSNDEKDYIKELIKLSDILELPDLLFAASSSSFTVYETLNLILLKLKFLRNKIAHGMIITDDEINNLYVEVISTLRNYNPLDNIKDFNRINKYAIIEIYSIIEHLLISIENISVDNKMDAIKKYLKDYHEEVKYICIRTSFKHTSDYLYSNIIEMGLLTYKINEEMQYEDIKNVLKLFKEEGGILIFTDEAIIKGSLPYVDKCINYDLPNNPLYINNLWDRFININRTTKFEMVILIDTSKSIKNENNIINTILKNY